MSVRPWVPQWAMLSLPPLVMMWALVSVLPLGLGTRRRQHSTAMVLMPQSAPALVAMLALRSETL